MHYNRHTTRSPHRLVTNIGYRGEDMPESYHGYEVGTFPRKRENPRFRYVLFLFLSSSKLFLMLDKSFNYNLLFRVMFK